MPLWSASAALHYSSDFLQKLSLYIRVLALANNTIASEPKHPSSCAAYCIRGKTAHECIAMHALQILLMLITMLSWLYANDVQQHVLHVWAVAVMVWCLLAAA